MTRSILVLAVACGIVYAASCSCGSDSITVRDSNSHTCEFLPHDDGGTLDCSKNNFPDAGCKADETPCWQLAISGPQSPGPQTWTESLCPACCSGGAANINPALCSPLVCSDTVQCVTFGVDCQSASCVKAVNCSDAGGCI